MELGSGDFVSWGVAEDDDLTWESVILVDGRGIREVSVAEPAFSSGLSVREGCERKKRGQEAARRKTSINAEAPVCLRW